MDRLIANRRAALLVAVAVALVVWGIIGFIDRQDGGWGGYTYSPDYVVNYIQRDGPGDEAGLEVGDRVISVEGIPVEELPLYSRWPRSLARKVGEPLRLEVERDGEPLSVDVVYGATPSGVVGMRLGVALIGLSFMAFGLWSTLTVRTEQARVLGSIGLTAGVATFIAGPNMGTWEGVVGHIQFAAMILLTLLLLRFFLIFPEAKRISESRIVSWILYGAWVLFLGCLVLELILHPALYHTFGSWGSLLALVYCLLAVVALAHTLFTTARSELWDSGMGLILIGIVVAVVPFAVAFITAYSLPGSSYFPLLLAVLPLTMALAVRRQAWRAGV